MNLGLQGAYWTSTIHNQYPGLFNKTPPQSTFRNKQSRVYSAQSTVKNPGSRWFSDEHKTCCHCCWAVSISSLRSVATFWGQTHIVRVSIGLSASMMLTLGANATGYLHRKHINRKPTGLPVSSEVSIWWDMLLLPEGTISGVTIIQPPHSFIK